MAQGSAALWSFGLLGVLLPALLSKQSLWRLLGQQQDCMFCIRDVWQSLSASRPDLPRDISLEGFSLDSGRLSTGKSGQALDSKSGAQQKCRQARSELLAVQKASAGKKCPRENELLVLGPPKKQQRILNPRMSSDLHPTQHSLWPSPSS